MTGPTPPRTPSPATPPPSDDAAPRDGEGSRRLLATLVEELARGGVTDAVTSPGSRNVPVLQALLAHEGIRSHSVVDERTAGFVALGLAKATGRPVVVACTSGSAAAQLLPAVVEAHHARLPLIVLTADRPAELRDVGAGQTIQQVGILGPTVRLAAELAVDHATAANVRFARTLAGRLLVAAAGPVPGPVHVDLPLREPLASTAEDLAAEAALAAGGGRPDGAPWVARGDGLVAPSREDLRAVAELLEARPRAVVVAGRHEQDPQLGPALAALCELLGLPLLADPLSGARRGTAALTRYDAVLRADEAVLPRPELVLRVGDLPTSKPLRRWLAGLPADVPQVHVSADGAWQDPDGAVSRLVACAPRPLLEELAPRIAHRPPDPAWLGAWKALDDAVAAAQDALIDAQDGPTEPWLARELPGLVPPAATLLVAASMPIRDVEAQMRPREAVRVLSNRGANGIDGTIATAWGLALGRGPGDGPVVVLLGDVALRHDAGSLLEAGRAGADLVVVLVDNDGGGIFAFLPYDGRTDAGDGLRDHVETPGGIDLEALAAAARASAAEVPGVGDLIPALRRAVDEPGVSILRVRTERRANRQLHARLEDAALAALGSGG